MAKKVLFIALMVGMLFVAAGCENNCPEGWVWEEGGANNPSGICKSPTGELKAAEAPKTPVTDAAKAVSDGAQSWTELNNNVVQPAMEQAHVSMDASVCATRYANDANKMAECATRMAAMNK